MLRNLKIHLPALANRNNTPAITTQAKPAMRLRSCGVSFGVMEINDGMTATGSTMMKSKLRPKKIYPGSLISSTARRWFRSCRELFFYPAENLWPARRGVGRGRHRFRPPQNNTGKDAHDL